MLKDSDDGLCLELFCFWTFLVLHRTMEKVQKQNNYDHNDPVTVIFRTAVLFWTLRLIDVFQESAAPSSLFYFDEGATGFFRHRHLPDFTNVTD